jgi:hypothetical protein
MDEKVVLYEEVQQMRQWWLWLIIILCIAPLWLILGYQLITGKPVGDKPASDLLLFTICVIATAPLAGILYFLKLTTRIDSEGICYGFNFPSGNLNRIPWSQIRSLEMITYSGTGYGYRISSKYGVVYNTSGHRGLQIISRKGSKLLLGTNNEEALILVLKMLRKL